jgi:hypothetical protein
MARSYKIKIILTFINGVSRYGRSVTTATYGCSSHPSIGSNSSSTRRLAWRPSAVSLLAMGER